MAVAESHELSAKSRVIFLRIVPYPIEYLGSVRPLEFGPWNICFTRKCLRDDSPMTRRLFSILTARYDASRPRIRPSTMMRQLMPVLAVF